MSFQIAPIRTQADHERALLRVEQLWGAPKGTPDGDELDVLVVLVEAYEREVAPVPPPDPIDAIRFAMDQRGLRASDVGALLGAKSRIYDILSGRRKLTLPMIRKLNRHLGIPLESLVGDAA